MRGYEKDPYRYDKSVWCIATTFEENPPEYLSGADMKNLTFEVSKRKAEQMNEKSISE